MPEGASIVQPVTDEERTATGLFLGWVAEILSAEDRNASRAERSVAEGCAMTPPPRPFWAFWR